jgi:hypothetical protein
MATTRRAESREPFRFTLKRVSFEVLYAQRHPPRRGRRTRSCSGGSVSDTRFLYDTVDGTRTIQASSFDEAFWRTSLLPFDAWNLRRER